MSFPVFGKISCDCYTRRTDGLIIFFQATLSLAVAHARRPLLRARAEPPGLPGAGADLVDNVATCRCAISAYIRLLAIFCVGLES